MNTGLGIGAPGIGGLGGMLLLSIFFKRFEFDRGEHQSKATFSGGGGLFGISSGVGVGVPGVGPIGISSGLGIGR